MEGSLSIGFIMAMYFSTNGIHSLIEGIQSNAAYHRIPLMDQTTPHFHFLVFILSLLVIVAIVLITLGPVALSFLVKHGMLRVSFSYYLIIAGKWIVSSALLFFAFSFLYYGACGPIEIPFYFGGQHLINCTNRDGIRRL
ncbi:MAG: hypothetical protein U0Z17_05515 [Bacteroidales bacterium]